MKKYADLLPDYLGGENIKNHASIMDTQDKKLLDKIFLLSFWNKLERPVLIQFKKWDYAGGPVRVAMKLFVNFPNPIQEIKVTGDITDHITFDDEITTEYTKEYNTSKYVDTPNPKIYIPEFEVTVTDIEGYTYTKGYPENDEKEGNIYDHDAFLDIIGAMLNAPRRKYEQFILHSVNIPSMMIPGLVKHEEEIDGQRVALETTEDDYYYYKRLYDFIHSNQTVEDKLKLFLKEIAILNIRTPGVPLIQEMIDNPQNIYVVSVRRMEYVNYHFDNVQPYIEQLLPCTRPVTYYPAQLSVNMRITCVASYPNFQQFNVYGAVFGESSSQKGKLLYCDFFMNLYGDIKWVNSENSGEAVFMFYGVPPQPLTRIGDYGANIPAEAPEFTITSHSSINYDVGNLFKLSLEDGAWQYKVANGTGVTNFEEPTVLANNNLNCGSGYMTYTPAINPQLIDLSDYSLEVTFHYTTNAQRILLGTLEILEGDIAKITGLNIQPRAYASANPSINDTHTLKFKFTDGICSVYYDNAATGVNKDFNGTEAMIYLAGYNSRANGSTQGLHIEEIRVE